MKSKQSSLTNFGNSSVGLVKQPDEPGFNQSFFTTQNTLWYHYVLNWLPNKRKPLVFLPCASAKKTREKFGKKMFSHSTTHQFLSAVTREEAFEKVVLSEPCTIVPYALEGQHPDYNIPPDDLTIQGEQEFTIRLANWLNIVKRKQPSRKFIYYIGGAHHYFILDLANQKAMKPFKIIHEIPANGVRDYSRSAKEFREVILQCHETKKTPKLEKVSFEKFLNNRGRYTNRKFWEYIQILKGMNKKAIKFKSEKLPVATRQEYAEGFLQMYPQNAIKTMKAIGED